MTDQQIPPSPFLAPGDPTPEPMPDPAPEPMPEPSAFAGRELHAIETLTIPRIYINRFTYRNRAWRLLERRHRAALILQGRQPAFDAPVIRVSVIGEVS